MRWRRSQRQRRLICTVASLWTCVTTFSGQWNERWLLNDLNDLCKQAVCWKHSILYELETRLKLYSPINTGMFNQIINTFECGAQLSCSRPEGLNPKICAVAARRKDTCCLLQVLRAENPFRRFRFSIVNTGHDYIGSPATLTGKSSDEETQTLNCFKELLEHKDVANYLTSGHASNFSHEKLHYLPIGLGTDEQHYKSGMQLSELQRWLSETRQNMGYRCESKVCNMRMLAMNMNVQGPISGHHRSSIAAQLSHSVRAKNLYPRVGGVGMLSDYANALFAVSPKGIQYDCWRHYEALFSGTIPIIDNHHTVRDILFDLPVLRIETWNSINKRTLLNFASEAMQRTNYTWDKLFEFYWIQYFKMISYHI